MPESTVRIVFEGRAQNLEAALHQVQADLAGFGAAADKAGAQAGEQLASGERKAAHEATALGERTRVAAEMVGLLGAQSSEQVLKVEGLSSAFRQAQHAFGGFGGAIAATAGSFALFRGLDFLHDSVDEAMQGEAAWARLSAAYAGNAQALAEVRQQIEGASESWAALGMSQAQVADLAARARGRGLDVSAILGDPQALADTAAALGPGTGIAGALDAIASPRAGRQVLAHLGLSVEQLRQATQQMQYMTAAQRAAFIEQQVEASRFKGVGTAFEQTDAGKLLKFRTMMQNLQEEVGTALLPAILQLVEAMTSLLQGAEKVAQPFGGLANVLKTLFVPMLGAGLLLFTNLRGVMTRLVDVLLGRLVGAFAQTAGSMAEADTEARTLATDIGAIPELVTTTADFVPATAIKDAYKANIASIPREWTTTATFVPAAVEETAAGTVAVRTAIAVPTAAEAAAAVAGAQTVVRAQPAVQIPTRLAAPAMAEVSREARTINALMSHALTAHTTVDVAAVNATVVDHVTERLGGIIRQARAQLAGAHLVANVGAAVTFTAGMEVANAIFNGAKFNQPDLGHLPQKVTFSAADQARLDALAKKLGQPQHVHVDGGTITANLGAIGGALVVNASLTGDDKSVLKRQIAALEDQKKAAQAYTTALQDAQKHPIPVQVHFDAAEMAKMVGEIALGTLIANMLSSVLNPKNLIGFFKGGGAAIGDYLSGKNVGKLFGPAAGGEASGAAKAINDLMGKAGLSDVDAVRAAENVFKAGAGRGLGGGFGGGGAVSAAEGIAKGIAADIAPAMDTVAPVIEGAVGLKVGGAVVGGLADLAPMAATAAVDIGGLLLSGVAEGVSGGLATPLVAVLLGALGAASIGVFTHGFGLFGKEGKKEADKLKGSFDLGAVFKGVGSALGSGLGTVRSSLGGIGGIILSGLGDAIKRGMIGLENLFLGFFNAIIEKVKSAPVVGGLFKGLKDIPLIPIPAPPAAGGAGAAPDAARRTPHAARRAEAPLGGAVLNTFAGLPLTPRGTKTSLTIPGYGRDIERGNVYGVGAGRPVRLPAGGIYDPTHSTKYEAAIDLPGGKVLDIMHIVNTLGTKQRTLTAGTKIGTALDFTNLKGYQASTLAGPRLTKEYVSGAGAVEVGLYDSARHAWARNAGGDLDIGAFLAGGRREAGGGSRSGGGRSAFGGAVPVPVPGHYPAPAPLASRLPPPASVHPDTRHPVAPPIPAAGHPALSPAAPAALSAVLHPVLAALPPAAVHPVLRASAALQPGRPATGHPALLAAAQPALHPALHPAVHAAVQPAVHHALGPLPRAALPTVVHPSLHRPAPVALHSPAAMHAGIYPAAHAAIHPAAHAAIHPAAHAAILPAVHQAVHQAVHAAAHVALALPTALHRTLGQPLPAPATHAAHAAAAALAARLAPTSPAPPLAAHHAAPTHPAPTHQTSHNTYNATFNIHDATDANAVARQVNRAFSEFVQGVRASRRLHG